MGTAATFGARVVQMSAGVILWTLHFAVIYGFTSLACARGFGGAAPGVVMAATLAAAAACVLVMARARRRGDGFEAWLGMMLGAAALIAIILQALPVLMVEPCG